MHTHTNCYHSVIHHAHWMLPVRLRTRHMSSCAIPHFTSLTATVSPSHNSLPSSRRDLENSINAGVKNNGRSERNVAAVGMLAIAKHGQGSTGKWRGEINQARIHKIERLAADTNGGTAQKKVPQSLTACITKGCSVTQFPVTHRRAVRR
jgi:hypothetical protein